MFGLGLLEIVVMLGICAVVAYLFWQVLKSRRDDGA